MRPTSGPSRLSPLTSTAALGVLVLALLACKKEEEPAPVAVTVAPPPAAAPAAAPETPAGSPATIKAGSNPSGGQRRGIVRSAPRFGASEVTRLTNGTAIRILKRENGGWLFISFKAQSGYIHKDVVSESGAP